MPLDYEALLASLTEPLISTRSIREIVTCVFFRLGFRVRVKGLHVVYLRLLLMTHCLN